MFSLQYYSPNDLQRSRRIVDPAAERKTEPSGLGPTTARARRQDPFYNLGINPAKEFRNVRLMADFITVMGMIKKRGETGLTRRNQRAVAKSIKRARNMGIIPMFSKPALID